MEDTDLTARLKANQLEIRRVEAELADVNVKHKSLTGELRTLVKLRDKLLAELAEPTSLPLFETTAPAGQPAGTVGHQLGAMSSTAGIDAIDRPLSPADTELVTGSVPSFGEQVHQAVCVELLGHKPVDADGLLMFAVWDKGSKRSKADRPPLYFVQAKTHDQAVRYVRAQHPAGTEMTVKAWDGPVEGVGAVQARLSGNPDRLTTAESGCQELPINRDLEAVLEAESDADAEEQEQAEIRKQRSPRGVRPGKTVKPKPAGVRP